MSNTSPPQFSNSFPDVNMDNPSGLHGQQAGGSTNTESGRRNSTFDWIIDWATGSASGRSSSSLPTRLTTIETGLSNLQTGFNNLGALMQRSFEAMNETIQHGLASRAPVAPGPVGESERRLAAAVLHEPATRRHPDNLQDSQFIRELLFRHWRKGNQDPDAKLPRPHPDHLKEYTDAYLRKPATAVNHFCTLDNLSFTTDYADPWNKSAADILLRDAFFPARNMRWENPQLIDYRKRMALKIRAHVRHLNHKESQMGHPRNVAEDKFKKARYSRRRMLFERRLTVASQDASLQPNVRAIQLLGPDGMSSDEESEPNSSIFIIHPVPWRSQLCQQPLRACDEVAQLLSKHSPTRRGAKRTTRQFAEGAVSGRPSHQIPRGLPANFYNMEYLRGHPDIGTTGINTFVLPSEPRDDLLVVRRAY